jgi:hypothetical protein
MLGLLGVVRLRWPHPPLRRSRQAVLDILCDIFFENRRQRWRVARNSLRCQAISNLTVHPEPWPLRCPPAERYIDGFGWLEKPDGSVDWAWPTRGAACIDRGALVLRLMDAGHHPVEAVVAFAERFPSWRDGAPEALAAFGAVTAALWREIAEEDGTAWKRSTAEHTATLAQHLP